MSIKLWCRASLAAVLLYLNVNSVTSLATPAQVMIIRHGEKDDGGNLNRRGQMRAEALVKYFTKTEKLLRYGIPFAIYATNPKHDDSSRRQIETVEPLAHALHLRVLHPFINNEIRPLVQEIMENPHYDGKSVLISWSHTQIPDIASEFGAYDAPSNWDSKIYDRTWVITFDGAKVSSFSILPQKLLPGDSD